MALEQCSQPQSTKDQSNGLSVPLIEREDSNGGKLLPTSVSLRDAGLVHLSSTPVSDLSGWDKFLPKSFEVMLKEGNVKPLKCSYLSCGMLCFMFLNDCLGMTQNCSKIGRLLGKLTLFTILRQNIRKANPYFMGTKLCEGQLESSIFVIMIKFKCLKNVNIL